MTIANTIGVALDNAKAYRQLEQFTVTLEERVAERTEELQKANEKLQELDRLKSSFVSIASHELRTPLTSIKGLIENLLDGLAGQLTERQGFYLSRVHANIERLTRMIGDLLNLSKIEAGIIELKWESVDMPELVTEILDTFQLTAEDKSISLACHQHGEIPLIQGDRDKISQILTNLVHNAIKFTPSHGSISVELSTQEGRTLRVCVTDTGCAVAPDELDIIFDRFVRAKSAPSGAQGAGLGLAITKHLVKLHGGHIGVTSTLRKGSSFYFTLPIAQNSSI